MRPIPTSLSDVLPRISLRSARMVVLAASVAAIAGCRDPQVAVYRAPKDSGAPATAGSPHGAGMSAPSTPASGAAAPDMSQQPVQTASGPGLAWTAPAHWESVAGSAMRKATFVVRGEGGAADLAVTAFPGDVGGEAANVNRWRGQVGLPPISEAEALSVVTRLEANGLKIGVVDLSDGTGKGARMLGAWAPHAGATWFFKLLGSDAVVAKEKPAFLEFLKTVRVAEAPQS